MNINGRVALYMVAIVLVLAYGISGTYILGQSGNFNIKISSLNQAAYFTIVTISTVGYGDITPITNIGRIFVMILIISGLSIFLSAVTVLSGEFLSSRIERIYFGSNADAKKLNGHIVLIGYDSTNAMIARRLKAQKRKFIIITGDKPTADSLRKAGYPAFIEDYTSKSGLEKFNLNKATDIVIDLRDSSKAVYAVLVAKKIANNAKISVIAHSEEAESHLSDLEVYSIVNPAAIAADILTKTLDRDQDILYDSKKKKHQ